MKGPANPGGVAVGVVFAVLVLVGGYLLGWDETTRRGLPVGLASVVAAVCFGWVAVKSWRKPRRR